MAECITGWRWSPLTATLSGGRDQRIYYVCKRCLDVALVLAVLPLLLPLMLVIAVAVKLDSPGSAMFIQERIGARRCIVNGQLTWQIQPFKLFKFRSMYSNVDESLHRSYIKMFVHNAVKPSIEEHAKFKLHDDPRITRVGRWLRRSSLDELPQIINILRGEMSIVGPRPVPEYEVREYREAWHHERLAATPGLTGLWQVRGRGQVAFDDMVRLDLEYVRDKSLLLDLEIIVRTIPAVLSGAGAE